MVIRTRKQQYTTKSIITKRTFSGKRVLTDSGQQCGRWQTACLWQKRKMTEEPLGLLQNTVETSTWKFKASKCSLKKMFLTLISHLIKVEKTRGYSDDDGEWC